MQVGTSACCCPAYCKAQHGESHDRAVLRALPLLSSGQITKQLAHLAAYGRGHIRALLSSILQRRSMQPRHEESHGCGGSPLWHIPHVRVGHWVGLLLH